MQTVTLNVPTLTPPIIDIVDWVSENPQRAAQVGASLIVVGVAILILAAIFRA